MSYHPMHLHGHQFRITALDGNPAPDPATRNVVLLAPGETADVEFVANNPGVWMLHCHDLHHADAGMHQMLRYEGYHPVEDDSEKAEH
jgi:FtsP/CotA-like multicopper oxidase with cupredoxin domain